MTSKANSEDATHLEEGKDANDDKPSTKAQIASEDTALEDKVEIEEDS